MPCHAAAKTDSSGGPLISGIRIGAVSATTKLVGRTSLKIQVLSMTLNAIARHDQLLALVRLQIAGRCSNEAVSLGSAVRETCRWISDRPV